MFAEFHLEGGRSRRDLDPPAHLEAAEPANRDPRPHCLSESIDTTDRTKRGEPDEPGSGTTRPERRGGCPPSAQGPPLGAALSHLRPRPVVRGDPGRAGTGEVPLPGVPAPRGVPGRRP